MARYPKEPFFLVQKFCRERVSWVDAGRPEQLRFNRRMRLCLCFTLWHRWRSSSYLSVRTLTGIVQEMFAADGLDPVFPFGSENVYDVTRNPDRVAWARRIAEMEVVES